MTTSDMPGVHDLCEGSVDLAVSGEDACSGSDVNIRYLLFLDLDNDDSTETVVSSTNLPGYNAIRFGNINTPNYEGGELREFDQRPVPPDQKYGFAIMYTMFGNKTARLRWNTAANPDQYVVPQLPYGKHKIRWIVTDACGNESFCEYHMTVKDCQRPSVICLNGLSVNIQANAQVSIYASDVLNYADDNCTPANQLEYSIIPSSQTTGLFPVDADGNPFSSIPFDCSSVGNQPVQLWVRDKAGNAGVCETYVIVQDNLGMCANFPVTVSGAAKMETGQGIEEAQISLQGSHPDYPVLFQSKITDQLGDFIFNNALPFASQYQLTPFKNDNFLNGVTTIDLVKINKHILGQEPLDSPYKMIAADVNHSGSITSFDIIELRKLILGIYAELPDNTSWRFVDQDFVFPNPFNPFETLFPEAIDRHNVQTTPSYGNFVGVKIGDVNNSAAANANVQASEDRGGLGYVLNIEDTYLRAGAIATISCQTDESAVAMQFTLATPDLQVLQVQPDDLTDWHDFAVWDHALKQCLVGGR
ncbi:MAG: hypothetical protein IPL65_15475 [Lewinellaceae bacterium]|nr:hypothetical protein [Lewinellaceae bacterium]